MTEKQVTVDVVPVPFYLCGRVPLIVTRSP